MERQTRAEQVLDVGRYAPTSNSNGMRQVLEKHADRWVVGNEPKVELMRRLGNRSERVRERAYYLGRVALQIVPNCINVATFGHWESDKADPIAQRTPGPPGDVPKFFKRQISPSAPTTLPDRLLQGFDHDTCDREIHALRERHRAAYGSHIPSINQQFDQIAELVWQSRVVKRNPTG